MTRKLGLEHALIGPPGRIGRVFRQCRVHVVPRLGAFDEDVGGRAKPARVVERADPDADDVRPGQHLDIERRTAIAAKYPGDLVAAIRLPDKAPRWPLGDAEWCGGHPDRRDIRRPARALTVAAMALQRKHRLPRRFVAHRAAETPAGPHRIHRRLLAEPWSGRDCFVASLLAMTGISLSLRPPDD